MLKLRRRKLHLKLKWGLLPRVLFAIAAGIVCGLFVPNWFVRIVLTFNDLFGNFLGFIIPLLIVGLVAPGRLQKIWENTLKHSCRKLLIIFL